MAADVTDDELLEIARFDDPALEADADALGAGLQASAGQGHVLARDRALHVGRGEPHRAQADRIHPDVDLALAPSDELHLTHAVDVLDERADLLVGDLRQVTDALAAPVEGEGEHRRGIRIELLDDRVDDVAREVLNDAVDLVAHFLNAGVHVLLQDELDDDGGETLGGVAQEVVDAGDGVDRLLDAFGDFGLDLTRAAARQRGHDHHGGDVHLGEAVDAQLDVPGDAEHREEEDEDRREDRAADGDVGEPLHGSGSRHFTATPSRRSGPGRATTRSPGCTPSRMPAIPSRTSLTWTSRSSATPPTTTNRRLWLPCVRAAVLGTTGRGASASRTRAFTKLPGGSGTSRPSTFASITRSRLPVRRAAPTWLTCVRKASPSTSGPEANSTCCPVRTSRALCAGTVNSSRIAPVEMSRTTGEAGPTYSPALTIRSATTPSKGARIWVSARLLCARRAWASAAASWASAVAHPASVR